MALTPQQRAFAELLGRGHLQKDAAKLAGYSARSENGLAAAGSRLAANPEVQAVAWREREVKLQGSLAHKALACLESILEDETAPAPAKVSAAKFVLEAAGHGIESRKLAAKIEEGGHKGLANMTIGELEAMISRLEDESGADSSPMIEVEAVDSAQETSG